MSSIATSGIVFACVFGGALGGMYLHKIIPDRQLNTESKDIMKLAMGLIGTMAALVIGLLTASAKSSYEAQRGEFIRMSSEIVLLDRVLANYGPETGDARDLLRRMVGGILDRIEHGVGSQHGQSELSASFKVLYDMLQKLSPQNEEQRDLKAHALGIGFDLAQTRWLLFTQRGGNSIPIPFLVVLVFWLTIILGSFGLYSPRNATALIALLLCALSVSGAIFLILELDRPFEGWVHFSSAPLRNAYALLGH